MDRNFYNNLTKEINAKLPDIDFDSDYEDNEDSNEPIKPYIRPAPEVLFGNADSSEDEELLDILQRIPVLKPNGTKNSSPKLKFIENNVANAAPEPVNNINHTQSHQNGSIDHIPYQPIELPNGIRSFHLSELNTELSAVDTIKLSGFGVRDNIDIDQTLDELNFDGCENELFNEMLENYKDINNANSEKLDDCSLLKHLDELAKMYTNLPGKTSTQPVKHRMEVQESLASLFLQAKQESSSKLVVLDLRSENKSWNAPDVNNNASDVASNGDKVMTTDSIKLESIKELCEIHSSDTENSEDDGVEIKDDLWIGNFRKSKLKASEKKWDTVEISQSDVTQDNIRTSDTSISDKSLVNKSQAQSLDYVTAEQFSSTPSASINDTCTTQKIASNQTEKNKTISEEVQLKIEKIKQRERILSQRRNLIQIISKYSDSKETTPLLMHEEISFDSVSPRLVSPAMKSLQSAGNNLFVVYINLEPPYHILTQSKLPTSLAKFSNTQPYLAQDHYLALLSILLSAVAHPTDILKFQVLSLHQIVISHQLQLVMLISTQLSLTKLKSHLKNSTMKSVNPHLSNLPLGNIMKFHPYDIRINHQFVNPNQSAFIWFVQKAQRTTMTQTQQDDKANGFNNSCLVIHSQLYLQSVQFQQFLMPIIQRFAIAGLRLIFDDNNTSKLVFVIRGYNVVETIKKMQNTLRNKELISCSRFEENVHKEITRYFGSRVDQMSCEDLISEVGELQASREILCNDQEFIDQQQYQYSSYSALYAAEGSYVAVIVSPLCTDVGWLIGALCQAISAQCRLVNVMRCTLTIDVCRQLGIDEYLIDYYAPSQDSNVQGGGVSHVLVLCAEHAMLIYTQALLTAAQELPMHTQTPNSTPHKDQLFYLLPFTDQFVDILDVKLVFQTPSVRELVTELPVAPYDDCEQVSFVMLISDQLTIDLAQLLDRLCHLDLLAVKLYRYKLSTQHTALLQSQFNLPLLTSTMMTQHEMCALLVVRSMFLTRELTKHQQQITHNRTNVCMGFTIDNSVSFSMIGSFFTTAELISNNRRRSFLRFVPQSIYRELSEKSFVSQLNLAYRQLDTAFTFEILDAKYVLQKFRKLWFLLTREGFTIEQIRVNINRKENQLLCLVKRPNAIFYLIQWINTHFSKDPNIDYVKLPEQLVEFTNKCDNFNSASSVKMCVTSYQQNYMCIVLHIGLLDSSVETVNETKHLWNFFEQHNYACDQLNLININGGIIFKLNEVNLINLNGAKIIKEGKYISMIIYANENHQITKDLMKSKFSIEQCHTTLNKDIYISNEVQQCYNILMA